MATTGELDDALTLELCRLEDEEVVLDDVEAVDDVEPEPALVCVEAVPGMVAAAIPPSTATAATAPTATHVVIWLSSLIASSRASILALALLFMCGESAYSLSGEAETELGSC